MAMLERIRKDEEVDTREGERKERKVEWICESCWNRHRDDSSQIPGRLTKEVLRSDGEDDSYFLLSF